jgi:hypothetical protein
MLAKGEQQNRAIKIAERARKRQMERKAVGGIVDAYAPVQQVIQLPLWTESQRAAPNSILSLPLFGD